MPPSRLLSEFSYQSGSGNQTYYFTVSVNQTGVPSVKGIRTPYGSLCQGANSLPKFVLDDIETAISQVEDILAQSSAINGYLSFAGEVSKTVTFATPLSSDTYRVGITKSDFIDVKVTGQTTTGFTVQTGSTYTGQIGYDVFI